MYLLLDCTIISLPCKSASCLHSELYKTSLVHPYSFDDFLMAQSVQRGHHGLGDLNVTNKLPLYNICNMFALL